YVGMTRAMERLYLTCARQRTLFGQTLFNEPSRFIDEIPGELLEDLNEREAAELRTMRRALGLEREASTRSGPAAGEVKDERFAPGDRVKHPKWGVGTVVCTEQSGRDVVVTLAFPGEGIKKVMVGIVPLEKV